MKTFRALAREFVIFGLVAGVLGAVIGSASYIIENHKSSQAPETFSEVLPLPTQQFVFPPDTTPAPFVVNSYDILACFSGATNCPPSLKQEISVCVGSTASNDPMCERIRKTAQLHPGETETLIDTNQKSAPLPHCDKKDSVLPCMNKDGTMSVDPADLTEDPPATGFDARGVAATPIATTAPVTSTSDYLLALGVVSGLGFGFGGLIGFALWIFYRVIRFAVKG